MEVFDFVLIGILLSFILSGWHYGFIDAAASLIGLIAGVLVAIYATAWLASSYGIVLSGWPLVLVFVAITITVAKIVHWILSLLDDVVQMLSVIPFLKTINRALGAVLGAGEGLLALLAIVYVSTIYLTEGFLREAVVSSYIVSHLSWLNGAIIWVLPFIN